MEAKRTSALGRALGGLSLACAARPRAAIAAIVLVTCMMGLGMSRLSTDADLLDILPRGNAHTEAAQNASVEFRGFYDFATLFYEIDEAKCKAVGEDGLPFRLSEADCGNVTDEAYVRGMEEVFVFLRAHAPAAEHAIDLAGLVKTVNYTNSAFFGDDPQAAIAQAVATGHLERVGEPRPEAWAMPGTDPQGEVLYEAAWRGAKAADGAVEDVVAPTWRAGRTLLFFNASRADRVDVGAQVYGAADAYQSAVAACDDSSNSTPCELKWNVFEGGLAVRGVSTLDAHASAVTQRDALRLAPVVALALVAILLLSFRDARVVLVSVVNLAVAFVWTAGLMGWLGIPFSALNLTLIPLILGVGIDYGIQMVSEHLDHKEQGLTDTEAFRAAGGLGGMAMLLATVTTVGGLALMVLSPSLLMAQLAIVASLALTVCFLFALTMVPALLVLTDRRGLRRKPEPGWPGIVTLCAWMGGHRLLVGVALLLGTGLAFTSVGHLQTEAFGNPELNYPKGDRVRDDSEAIDGLFFGGSSDTVSNYLIVEGDLTRPEVHRFLDNLTRNLAADPDLQGFNTASLTRVVRAWVAINEGTPDAVIGEIVGRAPTGPAQDLEYPRTQEEIEATFDDIYASPFANFMTILLSRDYSMGMVPFDTRQGLSYDEAARIWNATDRVIGQTQDEVPDSGVQVHQFGNNAVSYLFIQEELPWVNRVGAASFLLVTALVAAMTRSWRATLAIALVMALSSLWWLATLPPLGIGLSVGLMLPLVFISAIGSDNALHLVWNLERLPDWRRVYRYVGKAVTLALATDAIAFAVFALQTDLLVRKTMLATVASVTTLWVVTLLVVPMLYPPPKAGTPGTPSSPT
ncbi:MAG TPA: MMPL family transporter [Candidatus Thermoplasmatota archaeon]|nr:MMPL family transporter [Candidatus Thermoplasmatota archaeon]